MFARHLQKTILQELAKPKPPYPVLILEGARQVGKTTLVTELLKQIAAPSWVINLQEDSVFTQQLDQTKSFQEFCDLLGLEKGVDLESGGVLFIDEAQESLRLGAYVRFFKEKLLKLKVILSGSSMSRLFRGGHAYPTGRVKHYHLKPLSFSEFLTAHPQEILLKEYHQAIAKKNFSPTLHQKLLESSELYLEGGDYPRCFYTTLRVKTGKGCVRICSLVIITTLSAFMESLI